MKIELLAPAGNYDTMKAAIAAGADAVYLGGQMFGARAFAGNLDEEQLLSAIDYAHLHDRKIYLTVNTLLREKELEERLFSYLNPLYQQGLDAVIVQDLGVFSYIREAFPKLPVHASTQMTMSGPDSAKLLEKMGASRIVTPRELSLAEIRQIRKESNLEIESFVHGALCYCYSGQCLMSSLIGGRSGNRGKCAQPCRLPYTAFDKDGRRAGKEEYLLSPKDMNTLAILPEIIEAGVTSLKIEGRMKKTEYTAGVVSIYRKYLDRYLEFGKEGYRVRKEDQQKLWDLFNRKGFHESYYKQHNGRAMITVDKPEFREENQTLFEEIRKKYMQTELQKPVEGYFFARKGEPMTLTLTAEDHGVTVSGKEPEPAKTSGATVESVAKQLNKTGNQAFVFQNLDMYVEDGLFLPVSVLNQLRRDGFAALEQEICERFRREEGRLPHEVETSKDPAEMKWNAQVSTKEQLEAVWDDAFINGIYVESTLAESFEMREITDEIHRRGKTAYLALPRIFRTHAKEYFERTLSDWKAAKWDGIMIRSLEELAFAQEHFSEVPVRVDETLYVWNQRAAQFYRNQGIEGLTFPMELNEREAAAFVGFSMEMIGYQRAVMMISAQCIQNTVRGCDRQPKVWYLQDRMRKKMPVQNVCRYCYNLIYNSSITNLSAEKKRLAELPFASCRLVFTLESRGEVKQVLQAFRKGEALEGDYTKGHWKRGAE